MKLMVILYKELFCFNAHKIVHRCTELENLLTVLFVRM